MDVLEIARQRRAALARELARLDDFIRMGEELTQVGAPEPPSEPKSPAPEKSPSPEKSLAPEKSDKPVAGERPASADRPAATERASPPEKPVANTVRQFSAGSGASS